MRAESELPEKGEPELVGCAALASDTAGPVLELRSQAGAEPVLAADGSGKGREALAAPRITAAKVDRCSGAKADVGNEPLEGQDELDLPLGDEQGRRLAKILAGSSGEKASFEHENRGDRYDHSSGDHRSIAIPDEVELEKPCLQGDMGGRHGFLRLHGGRGEQQRDQYGKGGNLDAHGFVISGWRRRGWRRCTPDSKIGTIVEADKEASGTYPFYLDMSKDPTISLMSNIRSFFLWIPALLVAAGTAPSILEAAEPLQARPTVGTIVGRVVDGVTGEPIVSAQVRIRELGRSDLSHGDGAFHFLDVAPRSYTLVAQRIGYAPVEMRVQVVDGGTIDVELQMMPSALELTGVVVTGTGRERGAGETFRPTTVVSDAELRRQLESSLAGTIDHVPGIAQRYNGPAAAQPVIRGMGGDRVLVLEDGQRTGDLSTTGADHAVGIDPISVERIEIVRGPAGLMYGSNALGGVINVVREEVPRTLPETVSGGVSLQGESANRGAAGGAAILVPHGRMAVRADISGRTAQDIRTPLGPLPSSGISSFSGGLGLSRIQSWGYFGAAVRENDLDYGVPGEFGGEAIPGAHEDGVEIRSRRRTGRIEAGHFLGFGPFSSLSFDANGVLYQHREIEGVTDSNVEVVGARFENRFGSANLLLRHDHQADPVFTEGAVGLYVSGRELITGGGFTGTRDAREFSGAGYIFEELGVEPFRLQIGARYDWTRVTPRDLTPIFTGSREIAVRERTFGAVSASTGVLVEPWEGISIGGSLARAFRTPSVEELFSDGPHLADYSYNIGSPELGSEIGLGTDLFVRITRPRLTAELSGFRNSIRNYIHYAPTGELDPRFARFPVFAARGADAMFEGGEVAVQWEAVRRLVLEGAAAYVRGTRKEDRDPLPGIPPLNGFLGFRYDSEIFFVNGAWDAVASQNRVPRPIVVSPGQSDPILTERPTSGHNGLDLGAGFRWTARGTLQTITVQIRNATDAVRRDHLSRIKDVAPQPGRDIQLLYRVQF